MKRLWTEGRRKLVYGEQVFIAAVAYAFLRGADFGSLTNFLLLWLGIMLAAHVTAEKLGKAPGAAP